MSFTSPFFLFAYLPVTVTAYWLLPVRVRAAFLLAAGLGFYLVGDQAHVLILLLTILANYAFAWHVAAAGGRRRRLLLATGVCFDLALLGLAKYGGWLADHGIVSGRLVVSRMLPLGISFYVFAMLSYLIDVHRGHARVERSLPRFALYATLFPKLVAGPIVRYRDVAPQFDVPRRPPAFVATGVQRFIVGLAKKLLVANALAPIADEIFSLPAAALTPGLAWMGAAAYGLQLYIDFSAYSDMAIGLGRMLGFEFVENFNYPYVAASIREFWQRWHISLSTWFRDYLFLPLAYALSRRIPEGRFLAVRNDMWIYAAAMLTTMLLCGMWHGALWTFALWGLWHGAFLVAENSTVGKRARKRLKPPLRLLLTQVIVLCGWVVFRAADGHQIVAFFAAMAGFGGDGHGIADPARVADYLGRAQVAALAFAALCSLPAWPYLHSALERRMADLPAGSRWAADAVVGTGRVVLLIALLAVCAMTLAGGTFNPFAYQRF
jgi:alginate O-acetyltransferase complex protein AlgI